MNLDQLTINKNIKILITGCAGFIGSNLTEFFLKKGASVRGLDNLSTGFKENIDSALSEASKENKNINFKFINGDIRNYDDCIKSTKNIDIVLHQAALGSVQRSIEKPLDANSSNVEGTLNLLEASLKNKVKKFIYASSSSVYGDSKKLPKDESMSPNPKSIYAVTKLTAEYYCRLFYSLYGLKTVSLRYFNVFGKRQNPDSIYSAVIPIFLKKITSNKSPVIYGDGNQTRDFTYIDNVIYANYLCVLSDNENIYGNYYNVAGGENISLNEIISLLSKYFKKEIKPIYAEERMGDVKHSLASIEKIKGDLNYTPIIQFKKGLEELVYQ
ncbi:MAG: SDR family oxidoreductase [Chloroflexi bacterium]|nr:SDR family oxidoreductase [Chloroflexota bacterium]MBE3114145.1 SDR family oxidoreductase [Actinomycetota bacterium]